MGKIILVTGAAGFIGSHTVETLVKRGDHVIGLDNLNDYYNPAQKERNLREVTEHALAGKWPGTFQFLKGDIRDRELVGNLFSDHRFDAVVHLAAMAGVRVSIDDPGLYYDVNVMGTLALLDADCWTDWLEDQRHLLSDVCVCVNLFCLWQYQDDSLCSG